MRKISEICQILDVFKSLDNNPKSELEFHNAYTLLVAIVLSAQSTDKGVNKATKELFKIADTPQKMSKITINAIAGTRFYDNKATATSFYMSLILPSKKIVIVTYLVAVTHRYHICPATKRIPCTILGIKHTDVTCCLYIFFLLYL
jgi:hypothetical protein